MTGLVRWARAGEILSAIVAFFFLLGLPFPPDAGHAPQWIYLAGVIVSTAFIAWRLGGRGRAAWHVATGVALFVLAPLLIHLPQLLTLFHPLEGVTPAMTGALLVVYALGQVVALICAIVAIRRDRVYREPVAPAS
jgi:hypothetical protein